VLSRSIRFGVKVTDLVHCSFHDCVKILIFLC
jgi:hypothetical protein